MKKKLIIALLSMFSMAFINKPGGDELEIQAGNSVLLHQYLHDKVPAGSITISGLSPNELLRVRYSHCGVNGTDRKIALKDESDRILKEWSFTNVSTGKNFMGIPVKEITALLKKQPGKLYYFSNELKNWKFISSIQ